MAFSLTACRSDPPGEVLPEVGGLSDQQVLDVLAERAALVQRVMSSGTMGIESADGESIRLEVALLADSDGHLRLRAWKLGRAVFDVTRIGDELWVWSARQDDTQANADPQPPLPTAEQLDIGWRVISGALFASRPSRVIDTDSLVVMYPLVMRDTPDAPATARLTLDRKTQTIQSVTIHAADNTERAVYEPSRYRLIQGIPWATRIALRAPRLSLEITLDEVELNGELPAGAFVPPRDARKQP